MTAEWLNPALRWAPDEFVHLKLKTHVEFVLQNPFHNLARIDPAKDRRKEHRMAARCQIVTLYFLASPLVIFATTDHKFHFVTQRKIIDVRPTILVHFTTSGRL